MVSYKFCAICGRIEPCKWHDGKKKPEPKKKQVKFSGKSDYQKENGGFYGLRGR